MNTACNYKCKHAKRTEAHNLLLCGLFIKDGVDYNQKNNAVTAICAYQKYCPSTKQAENTKEAAKCRYCPVE